MYIVTVSVSMLLGRVVLGSKFHLLHIFGAISILFGVVVAVGLSSSLETSVVSESVLFYSVLLFLSNIPAAFSSLLKEIMLQHNGRREGGGSVNAFFLNTISTCYQVFFGRFVFFPHSFRVYFSIYPTRFECTF